MERNSVTRHADRVQAALASDAAARSSLVASWRRSSGLHSLDPAERKQPTRLSEAELAEARERLGPILHVAQPNLDRLFLAVGGVGCCVLLADRNGVPVERRGAAGDDATFRSWGLWPGNMWSESSEGTNGIGTCLVESRALTIHCDQHFLARNTALSCTDAPIYDHEGNLIAALDVSSCRSDLTEGFVQLIMLAVVEAARRIEAENFRLSFPGARILLTGENGTAGLLAVDPDDLVVGASRAARLAFGITAERLKRPLPAADLLGGSDLREENLSEAERATIRRALARTNGNVSAAAAALGISRATLHRKLKQLAVPRPERASHEGTVATLRHFRAVN